MPLSRSWRKRSILFVVYHSLAVVLCFGRAVFSPRCNIDCILCGVEWPWASTTDVSGHEMLSTPWTSRMPSTNPSCECVFKCNTSTHVLIHLE
ncbi:hypothetical protein BDV12DRAFT_169208 [Aspergillus spectabilis]